MISECKWLIFTPNPQNLTSASFQFCSSSLAGITQQNQGKRGRFQGWITPFPWHREPALFHYSSEGAEEHRLWYLIKQQASKNISSSIYWGLASIFLFLCINHSHGKVQHKPAAINMPRRKKKSCLCGRNPTSFNRERNSRERRKWDSLPCPSVPTRTLSDALPSQGSYSSKKMELSSRRMELRNVRMFILERTHRGPWVQLLALHRPIPKLQH